MEKPFSIGRKEKALRRKFSSFYPYASLFPSTSTVLRLKIAYNYKRLTT